MYVCSEGPGNKVRFLGTPSTPGQLKLLCKSGFVHVGGLTSRDSQFSIVRASGDNKGEFLIGEEIQARDLGKWDYNNGLYVVVTLGGEVWLRANVEGRELKQSVLDELCPNGKGAFVPLSNGEKVSQLALLCRMADRYHGVDVKSATARLN